MKVSKLQMYVNYRLSLDFMSILESQKWNRNFQSFEISSVPSLNAFSSTIKKKLSHSFSMSKLMDYDRSTV